MSASAVPQEDEGLVSVQLPSGAVFPVHEEEVDYLNERVTRYLSDNHFTNISDLQDVDRMLISELLCYRWGNWMMRDRNYWGDPVSVDQLQKAYKEHSAELRQLKKMLGIDKTTRDKQKGDDSVSAYIANLQRRAREFGVMRESQLDKALELFQQMSALVTLHLNSDAEERREMHVTADDLVEWLSTVAVPEFRAVDDHFRSGVQKAWIRSQ